MEQEENFSIRFAEPGDVPVIAGLIHDLAVYEKLENECHPSIPDLSRFLFGTPRYAEVLIAETPRETAGFALFFHNFSTFLGKPGLYLEDVFVKPSLRGQGIGRELLRRLASIAVERGCGRMEWAVLDWNQSAISFYEGLGARPMTDWRIFRLTGPTLDKLGSSVPGPGVAIIR